MCSLLRILSVVTIFIADVRTGALQQRDTPRRCHHCAHRASCEVAGSALVVCPAGQPLCATVATAPNFTSTLTCSAAASEAPCSLIYNSKSALEMTCICDDHLCNAPYISNFRNEMINFSRKIPANTSLELTEMFLKSSFFANVTKTEFYNVITKRDESSTFSGAQSTIGLVSTLESVDMPRAEALKHEATVPPDDDEDEGEGSGSFEDTKSHAAVPAPSSYLPAEENAASVNKNAFLLSIVTVFVVIL